MIGSVSRVRFVDGGEDGAVSADGRIAGAYVHGLFAAVPARAAVLAELGAKAPVGDYDAVVDEALDELAASLAQAFDVGALSQLARRAVA